MVPWKKGCRKIGPRKNHAISIEHCAVCVWNVGIWSIYENPKLDNKSSWTPLVFYSLVHVGLWGERQISFCVCSGSIDKNKKVVQISYHYFDEEEFLEDIFPGAIFLGTFFPRGHFSGDCFARGPFFEDHFSGDLFSAYRISTTRCHLNRVFLMSYSPWAERRSLPSQN